MSQENTTEKTPESGLSSHNLFSRALRAICLTRDYVGEKLLPAVEGWEWYDAGRALAEAIPDDEWSEQFRLRTQTRRGCVCQLCGKSAQEIGGYLARVNEKGVPGIWECRPNCNTAMEPDDRVMAAINGENAIGHPTADGQPENQQPASSPSDAPTCSPCSNVH